MVLYGIGFVFMKIMGFMLFLLLVMDMFVVVVDVQGLFLIFDKCEYCVMLDISMVLCVRFFIMFDFLLFEFFDVEGWFLGFNVDLVWELCDILEIQVKCQIQVFFFDELQVVFENCMGDVVIVGIGVIVVFWEKFDFLRLYLQLLVWFFVLKKIVGEVIMFMKFVFSKIGVVRDIVYQVMFKVYFLNVNLQFYDDCVVMFKVLKFGEVDMVFGEGLVLVFWVVSGEVENCCVFCGGLFYFGDFLGEGMIIMMWFGELFVVVFDYGFFELVCKGMFNELFVKYFLLGFY